MPAALDQQLPIARVYAESIAGLAAETASEDAILEELGAIAAALDASPELERFFSSPLVESNAQREVLERALRGRASDLLVDSLQVIRRKGRLELVGAVARAYRELWMARRGRVEVRVTTAVPLVESLKAELLSALATRLGKEPVLVESVRPGILGGMVVAVGDDRFDSSVAASLQKAQEALLGRAAHELVSGSSYVTNTASE